MAIPKEMTIHGHTRIDNYYWLNERDNPEVSRYLEAENDYTETVMKPQEALREKLFREITGRIKQEDSSVPYLLNGYWYYTRYESEKEHPVYCRRKDSPEAAEEIMLDGNSLAAGHAYFHIGGFAVSEDNNLLAYSVDTVSRRIYRVLFKDLRSGELLPDQLPATSPDVAWASDNRTLFYGTKDETLREDKIWRHVLGTDPDSDKMVFHEADSTFSTFVYKSKSRKYIIIGSSHKTTSEYRFLPAGRPDNDPIVFQERIPDVEYSIAHYQDRFYILTNHRAQNFRLMEAPVHSTGIGSWKEVIPHREATLLESFDVFDGFLALQERTGGISRIRVKTFDGRDYYVGFDEAVFVAGLDVNPAFDTPWLRFNYTSMTTPPSVFDLNVLTGERKLLKQQEVVGGYDPGEYQAERLFATATDGTKIPVSLVYRKDMKKSGPSPLLLYGYGSYGYSMDPWFSSVRLSLLDRGFIFAIAHIRGGEEMGRKWYDDGKLLRKKNTFTDFIACAEMLVKEKYTTPGHLYAMGGSAGGLLIGAVMNMRPDLFMGMIAAVPFVDVVTTMLDPSIPLTTAEYDEWGDPNKKEFYDYMLSYSPYDNVEAKEYPALLVTAGLHDSQVQYWEPAKWVAKLRTLKTDKEPLLLWTNMEFGHGGASGRFERYREVALEYAFLLRLEGVKD